MTDQAADGLPRLRVATWTVTSVVSRLPRLVEWLAETAPDVLCLQETKIADDAFPSEAVRAVGYEAAAHGDGRWNGVAILSRVGLTDVVRGLPGAPGYPDASTIEPRAVAATCGPVRVWSVYVPNGREPGHEHYHYKLEWLDTLRDTVEADAAAARPFAVLGDFNV